MNDFFTSESAEDLALAAKAEQELRSKIQADVFEGTPANFADVSSEGSDIDNEPILDADANTTLKSDADVEKVDAEKADLEPEPAPEQKPEPLSPEMQAIVDSVNKLTSNLTGMEDRIKQAERRVGGISNEVHAAKEAAAIQAKVPTPEAVAEAAKNEEAWEDLQKDFPSWADAINAKIKTQTSNFVSVSDFESLRDSISKNPTVDTSQLETRLVGLIHPDWKQITQDPKYASWLNVQSDDVKFKAYKGTTAEEAIDVFNQFKAHKTEALNPNALAEVNQIKAQRKDQLKSSTTTNTKHKTIRQKTFNDMTEAELREHIAAEVFAN